VGRAGEELVGGRTFDNAAAIHHGHSIADLPHQAQVVRDEQVGEAKPRLQILQKIHDLRLYRHIQSRDRFVRDDERRVQRQSAGQPDALPLAAAELVRELRDLRRVQADQAEQLRHPGLALLAGADAMDDERFFDDGADAHAGVERRIGILKDDLEIATGAPQVSCVERCQVGALEDDLSRCGLDQPQDAAAGGRLSTAGFTDQAERLAGSHIETDVVNSAHGAAAAQPSAAAELLYEMRDLQEGSADVQCCHAPPPVAWPCR